VIPGFDDSAPQGNRPAVAPAIGQPPAGELAFQGILKPSTDMQATRDGRRTTLLDYFVDLSVAHTFAAGTAILLDVQGNTFHSDPLFDLAGNAQSGVARIHFQDENFNPVGTYVTALPSALYKVPFTRLAVENFAQPGKFLHLVYGVDVDLVPGASQQVQATILNTVAVAGSLGALAQLAVGGVNALQFTERGYSYASSVANGAPNAANTPISLVAAGTNVNGVIVWSGAAWSRAVVAGQTISILAKATAPGSDQDGDVLCGTEGSVELAGPISHAWGKIHKPVLVAAGKAIWKMNSQAENLQRSSILYTVL
jgi:hypothetical protein